MALTTLPTDPASQRPTQEAMLAALRELQQPRKAIVAGAAATTRIAVAGIATDDVIVEALYFRVSGGNVVAVEDITDEATITAGEVAFSTTDTTGGQVLIRWIDVA